MQRWSTPPEVIAPKELVAFVDPVERADVAHRTLRDLDAYRSWLVRARAEAISSAYARGTSYADLGALWNVGGERVRQMTFQSGDARSGWTVAQDVQPRQSTPEPLPIGFVHAVRGGGATAACGYAPVVSLGADFTSTVFPACEQCKTVVAADI